MASTRLEIDGYGQLELNNVTFRRDGNIEAQCKLDGTDFKTKPAENGMLLAVDKANGIITLPKENGHLPIALNYTTEHMYDERKQGLKYFATTVDGFLPRLGYLKKGEIFTTNTISYDTTTFSTGLESIKTALNPDTLKTTPVYGGINTTDGTILINTTKPTEGPVLLAVKATTMPDGQFAIKFQVLEG